jgi:hypothetical protein
VLVKLKAVKQRPLTRNARRFLDGLVARSARLTVTFESSYSDGVELRMEDKRTVSEELNQFLKPCWKDALEKGKNPTGRPRLINGLLELAYEMTSVMFFM